MTNNHIDNTVMRGSDKYHSPSEQAPFDETVADAPSERLLVESTVSGRPAVDDLRRMQEAMEEYRCRHPDEDLSVNDFRFVGILADIDPQSNASRLVHSGKGNLQWD
jgi:hypothetical protein